MLAFGGYSVTVGRGNAFAHAWPNVARAAPALHAQMVARDEAEMRRLQDEAEAEAQRQYEASLRAQVCA